MNRTKITALIAIAAASAFLLTWTFTRHAGAGEAGKPASAASASAKVNDVDAAKDPESSSKAHRDIDGNPAEKFIENLPASKKLPKAPKARSVPAFPRPSIVVGPAWTFIGPAPIPNGQTETRVDPVSGRVSAIAINPTNPDIAYVGAAQGGVYRTTDGGTTWVQLMDTAFSPPALIGTPLAIGAITIDPTNSSTVLVGTGEGNLSGDSFFGSGFYIITGADGASPTVSGPFNARASDSADIFTGRSIVSIIVDPANHNNVFCATSSGVGGIVATANSGLPPAGLYRSTNAFSGTPTWTRLNVNDAAGQTNTIVTTAVMDPSNGNNVVCSLFS